MTRRDEILRLRQGGNAAELPVTITSTPAELNILDGVTSTATELNYLDGREPYLLACSGDVTTMSDDYTTVLGDAGTCFNAGTISGKTLTIPANATVAYPVGTVFTVYKSTNDLTLAVTTDTLLGSTTITATSTSLIIKVASTTWLHLAGAY